jgi:catechol 2,3-dioxygenase-like lactoylglutathione lyase family enzyme
MNVTHLRHLALAVPDFDRSRAFFTEAWGLRDAGTANGTAFLRTARDEAFQLALVPGNERRIERIAFGLATRAAVDAAYDVLQGAGVPIVAPPGDLTTPGGGYALRFLDPDRRCIELSAGVGAGPAPEAGPVPHKLAHVVVNTPDIDRATTFYAEILGLRVSDWSEHVMSFLRCDSEHHSLAFNAAPHASLNHCSWTMGSIDELFRAQGRIRAWGSPLMWGTGRHGPGNQVFNYFVEPSGYVCELIADGIDIADDAAWEPRVWVRAPQFMDLWGTSGPPSPEIRTAMTGTADPDYSVAAKG